MLRKKNALIAMAVAVLLAACGGGGGDSTPESTGSTGSPNAGTTNPAPTTGTTTPTADNSIMAGYGLLVGDQIRFSDTVITRQQLATTEGGAGAFTEGTNAPIHSFAFRIAETGMNPGETKQARLAFDITETLASAGTADQQETLRVLVTGISFTVQANGTLTIAMPADARVYAYVKNAAGATSTAVVENTEGLVSFGAVAGDTTSRWLNLDLEQAVTRAIAAATNKAPFESLKTFEGRFDTRVTLANLELRGSDTTPENTADNPVLTGETIEVPGSNQAPVTGTGVSGLVKVRVFP